MKIIAKYKNLTVAEADKKDLVLIEGNWYFPPTAIKSENFTDSKTHTTCVWKGEASYYNLKISDGEQISDIAWYYPTPKAGSVEIVNSDFANYVAFYKSKGIEITETDTN